MIELVKYDSNNGARRCNVCSAKETENTLHIVTVGNEHGGFEMVLCDKCLSELHSKIGQYMKDYNQECEKTIPLPNSKNLVYKSSSKV